MSEEYVDDAAFAAHNTTDHMKFFATSIRTIAAGRPEVIRLSAIVGVSR